MTDFDPGQHPRDEKGRFADANNVQQPSLTGNTGHAGTISSRIVTAKGHNAAEKAAIATAKLTYAQPGVAAMKLDPKAMAHNVGLFTNPDFYPNFRESELKGKSPEEQARAIVDNMKNNVMFLYNNAPEDVREGGMHWYQSAHQLVEDTATKYGEPGHPLNIASVTGVYAKLSPNKDWNMNAELAPRLVDAWVNHQNTPWDNKMTARANEIWTSPVNKKIAQNIQGKKLSELTNNIDRAAWIRTFDESHNPQTFREFDPAHGGFKDVVRSANGAPAGLAWQSNKMIADALTSLQANGDRDQISAAMGDRHKVRSFYNNILDPMSKNGDVTIDTHAVGGALLRSLGGDSIPVAHNFGNGIPAAAQPPGWQGTAGSATTGVKGTYGLYADAYRAAAKEAGILPQQMQAITWEAKRQMLGTLSDKGTAAVDNVWRVYHAGGMSQPDAQKAVKGISDAERQQWATQK